MTYNRFAAYADNGGVAFEKYTPAKPRKPKPKSNFAGYEGVDEEGFIPNSKGMTMTDYDTSRGPWHAMIDKQALAIQAQTGWSYEKSFTAAFTDPKNSEIVAAYKYDDLAKAYDAYDGGQRYPSNMAANIHKRVDELTLEKQARDRAEVTGETFAQAYTAIYCSPANIALRKAAPADPPQDSPGPAHDALNELIMARMKADPELSYQRAFTNEYTHPANRSLKQRVDAESVIHAQRLQPAKPFKPIRSSR
jgi:hypothetical protein